MSHQIILQAITGSHAYGLNTESSDTDRMAIFLAPTIDVAGLGWNQHKETWSDAGPEGDDNTLHELGKYLRLVIKGNPTLIELLFMNEYEILTPIGERLLDIRHDLLSTETVFYSYYNYAKAQIRVIKDKLDKTGIYKEKMSRHAMRIARQGRQLLVQGECNVRVDNPAEYFALTKMPVQEMLEVLDAELKALEDAKPLSVLQTSPSVDQARLLLQDIRIKDVLQRIADSY